MLQTILILMILVSGSPTIEQKISIYENHHESLVELTKDESYIYSLYVDELCQEDFDFFAQLVVAEAGHHFEGQIAVAQTVINRVEHSGFPDTYRDVIEQSHRTGEGILIRQFVVVVNGTINATATTESKKAIIEAYLYRPHPDDILFFRSGYAFSDYRFYQNIGGNYFSHGG